MRKLVLGCGYLGSRVANRWLAAGDNVWAITRKPEQAARFRAAGLRPIVADVTHAASLPPLRDFATILYAVGYDKSSERSMQEVYVQGLQNVLARLEEGSAGAGTNADSRFIYISSTGVYGEQSTGWVDEASPCEPQREGGRVCLAAERCLAASSLAPQAIVLRMAGIYGPGRIPRRKELLAGEPLAAADSGFLNLIHVDDATDVVLAAERRGSPPGLYVVSDGTPVERRDYYAELARLLQAPPPTYTVPPPDSPQAARAAGSKRLRNAKLLADLQVRLRYPSYREGLPAVLGEEAG